MRRNWSGHLPKAPQLKLPRGVYTGKRVDADVPETAHFFACPVCAEPVDMRDLGSVFSHEGPLPHPEAKAPLGWRRPTAEIVKFPKS